MSCWWKSQDGFLEAVNREQKSQTLGKGQLGKGAQISLICNLDLSGIIAF